MKTLFRPFGLPSILALLLSFAAPFVLGQTEPVMGGAITTISVFTGSGSVIALNLTNNGAGYNPVTPPTISFSGGGATVPASAFATVNEAGAITGITISDGGSGYTSAPSIAIDAPPGVQATASATINTTTGAVTSIVGGGGTGYLTPPAVTIIGDGINAAATASVVNGSVIVTLTSGGSGYTTNPTVTIAPPGVQATAKVTALGSLFDIPIQNESYGPVVGPNNARINITAVGFGTFPQGGYTYNFFANGVPLGSSTVPQVPGGNPGTISWAPVQPGAYFITCVVSDGAHTVTTLPVRYFATGTSILSPTDNSIVPVGSSVVIQATAMQTPLLNGQQSAFLQRIDFYADDVLIGSDSTYPYSIIYTPPAAPTIHTYEARGFDNLGNQISPNGTATQILYMVPAIGTTPTVRILNPIDASSAIAGSTINIIADVSAPSGFIKNVEFYVNGVLLTATQKFPFTATWTSQVPGRYQIVAIGYDDKSNAVASAPANFTATGAFPTASVASPTGGTFIQGVKVPVTVVAAGPDGGITSLATVQLLVDGAVNDTLPKNPLNLKPAPVLTEPFIFTWTTNVTLGTHRLSARVTDQNGLTITSTEVPVTIVANQLPQISITSSSGDTSIPANTTVTLSANATDPDGSVDNVEFFVNGASIGVITASPFQIEWTPKNAGPYKIIAKVTDNAGATVTSTELSITVDPVSTDTTSNATTSVYHGDYAQAASERGSFAFAVNRNNRGTFIAFSASPTGRIYLWSDIPVSPDGTFTVRNTAGQIDLTGQTSATGVSGSFGGNTFIGPIALGSGTSMVLNGTLTGNPSSTAIGITGSDGSITLYAASGTAKDAGSGTVSQTGAYSFATLAGNRFSGNVTNSAGLISGAVTGTVNGNFLLQQQASRLINISTRSVAGSGDRTFIAGFMISGTGTKPLLVRAVGPTLANFGVPGVLADPTVSVLSGSTTLGSNNDWGNSAALSALAVQVGAFPLNPGSTDAALQVAPSAGIYSVVVGGATTPGAALVELYDTGSSGGTARITNISTRGQVGPTSKDLLIAGFVINGDVKKKLLIRAVGPTLANFGVAGVLVDPKVEVFGGLTVVASNDNWTPAGISAVPAAIMPFPLNAGSKDAALVADLNPGAYTVQVSGISGGTGVVLVEIYDLDR